jgi:glycerate dehydrogenase
MAAPLKRPRAVFLDALSLGPADLDPLRQWVDLKCWPSTTAEQRWQRLQDADVAITNKIQLDGPLLVSLPKLKLVCTASTGTDQVDSQVCAERGITVRNGGRYSQPSVVQVTWALILELRCQLQERRRRVLAGDWQRSPVFSLVLPEFDELAGQHLSVVGAGDIGQGVARIGAAFGMETSLITSTSNSQELETALRRADVVSLHAPLTPRTRGLINRTSLGWLKPSALLVNMARGALVDIEALVAALAKQQLAGAALDVLVSEPPGAELDRLIGVPNLILTPHMAWSSRQARRRLVATIAAHLQAFVQGPWPEAWTKGQARPNHHGSHWRHWSH